MWQSMYKQKEAKKKKFEDEKENNRKKRLENKLTKFFKTSLKSVNKRYITKPNIVRNIFKSDNPKKKKQKLLQVVVFRMNLKKLRYRRYYEDSTISSYDDSSSNTFYKTEGNCLKFNDIITSSYTGVECEFCSHKYHLKCLSSTEYCDLGLKDTILFICNVCQKELGQ